MVERHSGVEEELRKIKYRLDTNARLEQLLRSSAPIKDVARLLDAEEFISEEKKSRQEPVVRFDVKRYIEREISRGTFTNPPEKYFKLKDEVVPADEGGIIPGSGKGIEEKEIIPRSTYCVEILSGLNIPYQVVEGTNSEEMMRGQSYKLFLLAAKQKIIFVNDEEGNTTFVIHNVDDVESNWSDFASLTKQELKDIDADRVDAFSYLGRDDWSKKMKIALQSNVAQEKRVRVSGVRNKPPENTRTKEGENMAVKAPPNWRTEKGIAADLDITNLRVRKIIENLGPDDDMLGEYKDATGKIRTHYSPKFIDLVRKNFESEEKDAPAGWQTKKSKSDETGVTRLQIEKIVEPFRAIHPEWFQKYRGTRAGVFEFYHPDLLKEVDKELQKSAGEAPEDYMPYLHLFKNFSPTAVEKVIEENHHLVKVFLDKRGRPRAHYHISMVQLVEKEVEKIKNEKLDENWVSEIRLRAILRTRGILNEEEIAEKIKQENKGQIRLGALKNGNVTRFYHSDFIKDLLSAHPSVDKQKILKKDGGRYKRKRDESFIGWKSTFTTANKFTELGATRHVVALIADTFRGQHPDWFKTLSDAPSSPEFYHPDLLVEIEKELKIRKEMKPVGKSKMMLAAEFKAGPKTIDKIVEPYRQSHPKWFIKALNETNHVVEYFHPDLITIIKEKLGR